MKVNVYDQQGAQVEEIDLLDAIFGIEPNYGLIHEAVVNYLANQRQGSFSAKTRAEVRGGGRKPFRQKGTGRARQGSIRSPHMKGGGVVFAKKPRDFSYKLPKKMRRLALKSALSDKVLNDELYVVSDLQVKEGKTKEFTTILKDTSTTMKTLIIVDGRNELVERAAGNLPQIKVLYPNTINTYAVMNCDRLMITKAALETIQEVYA